MRLFFSSSSTLCVSSADDFCCAFDLTYRVPAHFLDQAIKSSQLMLLDASRDWTRLIDGISEGLASSQDVRPIRICVPLLGSPGWGDPHPKVWMIFCGALISCNVTPFERISYNSHTPCVPSCGGIPTRVLRWASRRTCRMISGVALAGSTSSVGSLMLR